MQPIKPFVHLLSADADLTARVTAALAPAEIGVHSGVMSPGAAAVLLIDARNLKTMPQEWASPTLAPDLPKICFAGGDDAIIGLFGERASLAGVFDAGAAIESRGFASTIAALAGGDTHSIGYFLRPGAAIHSAEIRRYEEKEECFRLIKTFAESLGAFTDFPEIVVTGVWEMIMNALFDAARTPAGSPEDVSRVARIEYGTDGEYLAVSVRDSYGTLARSDVATSLTRCHRRGEDQVRPTKHRAGIGLYMIYSNSNQLHFRVRPGQSTGVISIFRLAKRYKDFEAVNRCLSFLKER